MRKYTSLLALLFVAILSSISYGETASQAIGGIKSEDDLTRFLDFLKDPSYSEELITPDATSLPEKYRGNNPQQIWAAIAYWFQKDEFETTKDWEKKIANIGNKSLCGKFKITDLFAFQVADGYVATSYDADNSSMSVDIPFAGLSDDMSRLMPILFKSETIGFYNTQNAFGASFRVEQKRCNAYHLCHSGWSGWDLNTDEKYRRKYVSLTMTPDNAKRSKDKISMMAICHIAQDDRINAGLPVNGKQEVSEPTIQNPVEEFTSTFDLSAHIESIWIYNFETGEIYAKIGPRNKEVKK